ncbi:HNH endonuclease [Sphingomonas sp. PB2P12]|uniref:HNH endonuclease n=1 Tax=Sphingomonas sandaracina TaxID=3096157 RepID=UPI002FC88272
MNDIPRDIPEPIKRVVRQECAFGCVLCGTPVFDYDHVIDFSLVNEHSADNIALLCKPHHADKTAGRISRDEVARGRKYPFNLNSDKTGSYQIYTGNEIDVWLGSNRFYGANQNFDMQAIWINGTSYLTVHREGARFTFSTTICDASGNTILAVNRGELTIATGVWDYRFEGTLLSIRSGSGNIELELDITSQSIKVLRGHFHGNYETSIVIRAGGDLNMLVSGLEIANMRDCSGEGHFVGVALARGSCISESALPSSGGFLQFWNAEYELMAEKLRLDKLAGRPIPPNAIGIENFRPYPR